MRCTSYGMRGARIIVRHTGRWGDGTTDPATLNSAAAALGPNYNIFAQGNQVVPTPPAFIHFDPPAYLRPFDIGDPIN